MAAEHPNALSEYNDVVSAYSYKEPEGPPYAATAEPLAPMLVHITVYAPEEGEPLADEAASFVEELEGLRVGMTHDAQIVDAEGEETLVYVWLLDGVMLNARLVREGYAQVSVEPPNVLYANSLIEHQEAARLEGRGIWGLPLSKRCLLADHGNGIGRGSASCREVTAGAAEAETGGGRLEEGR